MTDAAMASSGEMPTDANDAGLYATYVPHDIDYNEKFEDSIMHTILSPTSRSTGLRVIADDSAEQPVASVSIRNADTVATLPQIQQSELPLPLSDARRVYASNIPGVKLTHPSGYAEGGPGIDPEIDTFSDDFLTNHPGITTPHQLQQAIDQEIERSLQSLRERMRDRQNAKEKNEAIGKEMKSLDDQHSMELKIQRRMLEDYEAKKQAKERKRREREGG